MPLFKSRPRIRVRVPNENRPGDEIRASVLLDCRKELEIEHVEVLLECSERCTVGSGKGAVTGQVELLRLGARLAGPGTLKAGLTELAVRIPLPSTAPPSYRGTAASIEYTLSVHVSIDWWPDARAAFELKVVPLPVASPETAPAIFSSEPSGPRGEEPHAELSLASTWTRAGDLVSGAIALANVGKNRYSDIRIAVCGKETLYLAGIQRGQRDHLRYEVRIGAEEAREGEMLPFRFRLPDDVAPDLAAQPRPDGPRGDAVRGVGGLVSLAWNLEVTVGIRWGSDLEMRIPLHVLPLSSRPGDAPLRVAPPTVGSDRIRAAWEALGAPLGLRYEGQALHGSAGETSLAIRRDHKGRGGIYLVAELAYPELHLALSVEPASPLRKMIGGGIEIGDPEWDGAHHVCARDASQAALVMRSLFPALKGARVRRLDDRNLVLELRDSGQRPQVVQSFAKSALALARLVEQTRQDLPPPTSMRHAVDEWRALARTLQAPLETARMRIEGQLGAYVAEVRTSFDAAGAPLHTWLSIQPSTPFDAAHAFAWRAADGTPSDARAQRLKGTLGELVAALCQEIAELSVEPERVMVCLPAPLGAGEDGRGLAVLVAERKLERMAQLATLLRGPGGPYR